MGCRDIPSNRPTNKAHGQNLEMISFSCSCKKLILEEFLFLISPTRKNGISGLSDFEI